MDGHYSVCTNHKILDNKRARGLYADDFRFSGISLVSVGRE